MGPGVKLDIGALVAPFPGAAPAGVDPRSDTSPDSFYQRLKDARSEARDFERLVDGGGDDKGGMAQRWRLMRDLSQRVLLERGKDLEVAAWLTEALLREAGVPGLTAGATVLGRLVVAFWDGLFPTPDEDGLATRVAPITGLNGLSNDGTLAQTLRKQAMFRRSDGERAEFLAVFPVGRGGGHR